MSAPREAAVRVPCSTSNLGSGFDTLGLALDRYLEARFTAGATGTGLVVERTGTLAGLEVADDEDLSVRAFRRVEEETGRRAPGRLVLHSEIPLARGLGSSAAALVAGHAIARAALGLPSDPRAAFEHAAGVEGHGDNAAPCAFGGFQAVARDGAGLRVIPLELSPEVGVAWAAPATRVATRAARAALPSSVEHARAVEELGYLAALVRGLAAGDAELVRLGMQDTLHVPYRLGLIPGGREAMEAGRAAGAWGVTISGAGSGLVALCGRAEAAGVAAAMESVFASADPGGEAVAFVLTPDRTGMRTLSP